MERQAWATSVDTSLTTSTGQENDACDAKFRQALDHLRRAAHLAKINRVDTWQFAVEVADLLSMNLTRLDIRWLISRGLIQHGYEVPSRENGMRQFTPEMMGLIREESCFVLANRPPVDCSEGPAADKSKCSECPTWNAAERTLVFRGLIVKKFRCPALNQQTVLSAFQDEKWDGRIWDPLPPVAGCEAKQRLHDTIRNLNRNQIHYLLQFRGDGTGQGVLWEPREG